MINIKNSLIILLFSFNLFANQGVFEWSSMTSLINSTDITKDSNGNILSTTNGGIFFIENNEINILKDNLNNFDLSLIGLDYYDLIWVAGTYPNGNFQVFNSDYELIYVSDYLDIDSIIDIVFKDDNYYNSYSIIIFVFKIKTFNSILKTF